MCKTRRKQTFPPTPAGLAKPRRSFTEALVVFCREQKNRHAEIWDNVEDKANPTTLQPDKSTWTETQSPVEGRWDPVRAQGELWVRVRAGLSLTVSMWSLQAPGETVRSTNNKHGFYNQILQLQPSAIKSTTAEYWANIMPSTLRSCDNIVRICPKKQKGCVLQTV